MKRLLILSADPLSQTFSNGKTLESMIGKWNASEIAQLYCASYEPSSKVCSNFFQITDSDIIKHYFFKENIGKIVFNSSMNAVSYSESKFRKKFKNNSLARLTREIAWHTRWNKCKKLNKWLDSFNPEVVLFVGGNLLFMYDMCRYILDRYDIPLIFQVTDDYIDRKKSFSVGYNFLYNETKKSFIEFIHKADMFITIGDLMRETYREKFGKDSITFMNAVEIPKVISVPNVKSNNVKIIYAGSLYYGRENIVLAVRNSIKRLSKKRIEAKLYIYTSSSINKDLESKLNDGVYSNICGYVDELKLKKIISQSDILLFVEDFSQQNIERTKLSVSTKLPEYMVSGRCIFAIGPSCVGSMKYAESFSCTCNSLDNDTIDRTLQYLIENYDYRFELSKKAFKIASKNHSKIRNQELFSYLIERMMKDGDK